jgi:hypothetical protein
MNDEKDFLMRKRAVGTKTGDGAVEHDSRHHLCWLVRKAPASRPLFLLHSGVGS